MKLFNCFLLLALLTACAERVQISEANGAESMTRRVIQHDGIEREYFVHVPVGAGPAAPLVVAIHGYTSTATGFEAAHNLNPHADANNYVVAYPQGSHFTADTTNGTGYRVTSWNDLAANLEPGSDGPHCVDDSTQYPCPPECGSCSRCAWTSCYDDVGFVEKMLDEVVAEFRTDPARTYLLGVSNGGMMALRLGCNLPERFAAIAPIIGQLAPGYACGPTHDVPLLHLFGGQDDTVRFDGKPGGDGFIYATAEKTAKVWADALACDVGPTTWENEFSRAVGVSCAAFTHCRNDHHKVVSCLDPDGGHDWPGQRVQSIPATCVTPVQYDSMPGQSYCPDSTDESVHAGMDLVWNFFRQYSK
ncbi:MAG: alpha/beta hydrolase family esterase [Woeseiaceae bacterium]